jgi:hypothetical protein
MADAANSAARVASACSEAENVLEVGQAVVAAEAHLVAEEGQQQA